MSIKRKAAAAVVSLLAAGGLALAVACGNTQDEDPTPVTTPPITPAAPRTVVATPTKAATPASTPSGDQTPSNGGTITLIAKNIKFDTDTLTATAGSVKIIVDNQDTGVPHNVHIYKGKDAKGESVGSTELTNGPAKEEVTLDLEAGEYFFVCDAHPNMKGTLTVS